MDKLGVGIIALAIIAGAVILGGAIVVGSFFMFFGSSGVEYGVDYGSGSSVDMSAYLKPINGSQIKNYKDSCIQLDNAMISTSSIGKKVKVQGKIISILENTSNSSSIFVQVPEISNYPYVIVTYGSSMSFNTGDTVYVYGEYADLVSVPDPNSGEYKMAPMIKAVYLQKF